MLLRLSGFDIVGAVFASSRRPTALLLIAGVGADRGTDSAWAALDFAAVADAPLHVQRLWAIVNIAVDAAASTADAVLALAALPWSDAAQMRALLPGVHEALLDELLPSDGSQGCCDSRVARRWRQ